MKYDLKIHGVWNADWWLDKPGKERNVLHIEDNTYGNMDEKLFKEVLKDQLDLADFKLTPKNIKREFGHTENGLDISKDCIRRIIGYYKFRAELYRKICDRFTGKAGSDFCKELVDAGMTEAAFKYDIPAEYNNFSCEDPKYDGGQLEAYVEVCVYL